MIRILSVTDYAKEVGKTPQGVRWQIYHDLLPEGVTAKKVSYSGIVSRKIGEIWEITVKTK